jgi:hypothetical protein
MFKNCLLACVAAAATCLFASAANAAIAPNVSVNFTITSVAEAGLPEGATGHWYVYASVTGATAGVTDGLGGVTFSVIPSGNLFIVDHSVGDGNLDTEFLAPNGVIPGQGSLTFGFNSLQNPGGDAALTPNSPPGSGIQNFQNTNGYRRVSASNLNTTILKGTGLAAGTQNGATWDQPILIAGGYYGGDLGTLTVTGSSNDQGLLPILQTATNTSVILNLLTPESVNGASVPVGVPEPASLGVLALGGLALLARRRKAC